jgi:hypothetical protein
LSITYDVIACQSSTGLSCCANQSVLIHGSEVVCKGTEKSDSDALLYILVFGKGQMVAKGCGLWFAVCGLWIAIHKLQVANCPFASC